MQVLVINAGSSSVKFKLVDMPDKKVIIKGQIERIGGNGFVRYQGWDGKENKTELYIPDYQSAFRVLFEIIPDIKMICAVGHRVAHGGNDYTEPVIISDRILKGIQENAKFAPLHNHANIQGICACLDVLGDDVPQVAVFDTGFHATLPEYAYLYAIPYEYYKKYGIRRFGFHGLSHRYISRRCCELIGSKALKIITCHLGNGCSLAAVKNGKSVDTSMGMTPNEGCMMGTRSGNIDPAILDFIAEKENCSYKEILDICNNRSGLLGVSGISNDYRDLTESNDDRAKIALKMQNYQIVKIIGAYLAVMDGADAIAFSGGIGANAVEMRKEICDSLGYVGVILDDEANLSRKTDHCISAPESKIAVYVIATDEEMMIADDTYHLIKDRIHKNS